MTLRERLYEWLATKLSWGDYFDMSLYLGPEYLDRPLYEAKAAFDRQIGEIRRHYLDEGVEDIRVTKSAIDLFTEQGGRRVIRMQVEFEIQPRHFKARVEVTQ